MSRVVVGVAGGIAAYKSCSLVRLFAESGHEVTVVPTENALRFVGAVTWAALSGNPVSSSVFDSVSDVPHVRIGQQADLVVIAPATADLLSRAAAGRADDLLTNVLLTAKCPVLFVPAMHTEMWEHPATQANVHALRSRGVIVMEPASGRLTGADSGAGRMPEAVDIFQAAVPLLDAEVADWVAEQDLAGSRFVVSAGGTREALDPVRFIGNHSSGKMGLALARAAALRGAEVTVVAANLQVPLPAGVDWVPVRSTADLAQAMLSLPADVVVMAAAPADFTPVSTEAAKIKKDGSGKLTVSLTETTDVLASLVSARESSQTIVGFAAETASSDEELLALGSSKLARKGCDLLVLNNVSGGAVFGADENSVVIIGHEGIVGRATGDKNLVAHTIISAALAAKEEE